MPKDLHRGLTRERLMELLDYDPATGIFRHRVSRCSVKAGDIAGRVEAKGYVCISIDGARYKAHRLAWFYIHGVWPEDILDHDDRTAGNNLILNLRPANGALNKANSRAPKNNTTGFKGVSRLGRRFVAGIKHNYRRIHLGVFATAEEAARAYDAKAIELWGDFANTNERTDNERACQS
jgi:hypothetical protein